MKASDKRTKILEAAKSCFIQFGFEKTTLDDIGRKLSLNKSSLYYYFKNKEEIFTAVIVREAEVIVDELHAEFLTKEQPEAKIQAYMKKRFTYYRKIIGLHQLDAESIRQIQPRFHELYSDLLNREVMFISRELKRMNDSLSVEMADRISNVILSASDGIKHDEILHNRISIDHEPDYNRVERETELLLRLILNGVKQTVKKHYLENSN
jgi:AcrR family transcriptional regulator